MADDRVETIDLPGGRQLVYWPAAFAGQADDWFAQLYPIIDWRQDTIRIAGKHIPLPRLQAWYGEHAYRYSGIDMAAASAPPLLEQIRQQVEQLTGRHFNAVLANLYRNGNDSVGWHSDDEPELGPAPVIASLSLGALRRFSLRPAGGGQSLQLELAHGSLLLMTAGVQADWQHALLKAPAIKRPRINLTFRYRWPG
ncbi:MAG TPA: alpha-ketoglutarate-dependent dioxygenase AlkB [Pseudomonadales bacterium]